MTRSEYRASLALNGVTQRERTINKALHDTTLLGKVSPSYKAVTIDDVPRYVNIISATVTNQKIIRTRPGEDFQIGSILYWSKSHWLITERDADDEITVRGRIQICQKQITWQDDLTKKIVSLWATVEKPYYSNLSENKTLSYSTREFRVQMPFDEYSARLNIGKRLMLEIINGSPKTYRITSIDQMTGRTDYDGEQIGFLSFNVEQDLYNSETDNVDKMICDYVPEEDETEEANEFETPEDNRVLSIDFTGEPSIPTGGFGKLFTAKVDGEVYEDVTWTLVGDSVSNGISFKDGSVETTGAKCKVICADNSKLIGQKFTLSALIIGLSTKIELEVI